jgi:multidrug resistance efflux pump
MSVQAPAPSEARAVADTTTNGAPSSTSIPASIPASTATSPTTEAVPAVFPQTRSRRGPRRMILPIVLVGIVFGASYYGWDAYQNNTLYVSTDNAQLTGQPVQVGPTSAGRVGALNVSVGATVHKGEVIAQVVMPSQVGMAQNGAPKVDFVGAADTRVDVVSPIDGIVIAVPSAVGATVGAGQSLVTVIDPTQLWVNANIEETKLSRVKVGEAVDVYVDALGTTVPGRVVAITPATGAVFSMLPTSNASGNFTKVTQLVPVRIAVSLGNQPMLLGASVEVKIHVR